MKHNTSSLFKLLLTLALPLFVPALGRAVEA